MNESHPSLLAYSTGFILSLVFTLVAYAAVTHHTGAHWVIPIIITLAFVQLITQMIFFLHIGKESKPYFNLFIFVTTFIGMLILVLGSLWIMNHLNSNMSPAEMQSQILHEEGIQL